ncbi:hypothetical protein CNBD5290 [Cryptococcus deneoformans B-3501A]|uniref:Casein kinase substrate phosphoprotein PP28 domain-containing protein n=1 Tax=Cryptococcus deneoformans (strain JEC21 / ATCC MYA-565) TaxID=214684 RepID=Q5KJ14_CRYD1|nr:hypothetical protein CND01010 [Cryptococcus neoformans var. neoformans JEC21]XP_775800.1 hypothetical protein CNBD5290 [Cryptococcus neoformans var. neoformans B-3501A]AAW43005.2 hypothetical protein CND01010 [Cryptococcus neoformans var. neoformans JEC21]EAL21153.1 hypothetical protein CNBD5290 [Cryptococcus neoformans var. neoformans B-3501A]
MGRGGGVSSRGRGKFKVARGGGRHFSRDLDPRFNKPVSESSEEESSEEESSEDETAQQNEQLAPEMAALNLKLGNTVALDDEDQEPGMSRAEKKAMKKAQGEKKVTIQEPEDSGSESDEEEVMPAPVPKGKAKVAKKAEPVQMSRKEREAAEKKAAEQRYQNLHAQGKTMEAKTDLARLQEVRARREAAAAQRKAEAEEKAQEAAAKKEKLLAKKI